MSTFSTACDLPNCLLISHVASSTLRKRIKSFRHAKTSNINASENTTGYKLCCKNSFAKILANK